MSSKQRRKRMESLLARRHRLGLTYQELSVECGIPAGTLASWQSRLRREEAEGVFTELVLGDETGSPEEAVVEVVGPHGHRVLVTSSVDEALLERVLRALPC